MKNNCEVDTTHPATLPPEPADRNAGGWGPRLLLVPLGLVLAGWLIWRLGPQQIWNELIAGSWSAFGWVIVAYSLQQALGTLALWMLGTNARGPGWRATSIARLARVRYVGEVLNYFMPTGAVGGEPYKYFVLRGQEGRRETFQVLVAAKFLHLAATGPFAAGVFFAAAARGVGDERWVAPFIGLGGLSLLVTATVWGLVLWHGVGRALIGGYYRVRRRVPRRLRGIRKWVQMDRQAARQIRGAWFRAVLAYTCYVGVWCGASLEWLAAAALLGVDWQQLGLAGGGLFVCTTLMVSGLLPVPGGLGTQEAGKVAVASLLGLAPQVGIAMSLVRRGREVFMVLTGVLVSIAEGRRPVAVGVATPSCVDRPSDR